MRLAAQSLARLPEPELVHRMRLGVSPKIEALVGWEFLGYNVPALAGLLGFRKFAKGFYLGEGESPSGDRCRGYNVLVEQNDLHQPWIRRPSEVMPKRHGFYDVYPARENPRFNAFPNGLLIDYAVRENGALNPERVIRDYLVQPDPKDPDILLGFANLALGPMTIQFGCFVLERDQPPLGFIPPKR